MVFKRLLWLFGIAVAGQAVGGSWYWDEFASDDWYGSIPSSIVGMKGFALTDWNGAYKTSFKAGADVPLGWALIANDSEQTLKNCKTTWSVLTRVGTYKGEVGDTRATSDRWASQARMYAMQNLGPESSGDGYAGSVKFEAESFSPMSRTFNFKILESGVSKEEALDLGDQKNNVSFIGGGSSAYYWFGQSGFWHADGDAAQSGLCGKGDTSYMSAFLKVPCRIRFKWLLVGDTDDSLTFYAERGNRRILAECPKRQANLYSGNTFAQSPDFIFGTNGYRRAAKAETVTWEFKRGYSELELDKTHSGFVDEVEIKPLRKVFFYSHGGSLVDFIWVEPGERFDKWMPLPDAPKRSPRNACGEPDAYTFAGWYDDCEIVWDDEHSGPRHSGTGTLITNSSIVPDGIGTIFLHPKWVLVKPNTCYGGGGGTGGGDVGCRGNCEEGVDVCVVLLNANGGFVSPDRRIVVAGQATGYLPDAEWEGYVFDGWFTAAVGGSKVSESTIVNADMTLHAHWIVDDDPGSGGGGSDPITDHYTLTLNPNGGTLSGNNFGVKNGTTQTTSVTVTYGKSSYANLGRAVRSGYTFTGWWTSPSGGTRVFDSNGNWVIGSYWNSSKQWIYKGDVTLYAQWQANTPSTYTLTLNPNGGKLSGANFGSKDGTTQTASVKVTYGKSSYANLGRAERSGYTFTGWWTAANGGTRVFDSNGNWIAGSYWNSSKQWIYRGDVYLYAQWREIPQTYTLTLNPNGGVLKGNNFGSANGTTRTASVTVTYGKSSYANLGRAEKGGYTFTGWWTASNGGTRVFDSNGNWIVGSYWNNDKQWVYKGNVTLYAQWSEKVPTYSLGLNPNGGTLSGANFGAKNGTTQTATVRVIYGKTSYNAGMRATRSGYTFMGWWTAPSGGSMQYDANGKYVPNSICWTADGAWRHKSNAMLYARWTTVTFNPAGGTLNSGNFGAKNGTTQTANVALKHGTSAYNAGMRATRSGYMFIGWWTATSGGSQIYDASGRYKPNSRCWTADGVWKHEGNATLYARWLPLTFGGAAEWSMKSDGSWKSGAIASGQTSWLRTTVKGAGTMTFHWKVASKAMSSYGDDLDEVSRSVIYGNSGVTLCLSLMLDGIQQASIDVTAHNWGVMSLPIDGAGTHTVQWIFYRKVSTSDRHLLDSAENDDYGQLRNVYWSGSVQ